METDSPNYSQIGKSFAGPRGAPRRLHKESAEERQRRGPGIRGIRRGRDRFEAQLCGGQKLFHDCRADHEAVELELRRLLDDAACAPASTAIDSCKNASDEVQVRALSLRGGGCSASKAPPPADAPADDLLGQVTFRGNALVDLLNGCAEGAGGAPAFAMQGSRF